MTGIERPPGRYDERRPLPRPVLLAGGAVLGLLLVGLSYLAYDRFSGSRVQYTTVGYRVLDDRAVEVDFEVRKDLGDTVECRVHALSGDGVEVASALVRVGPSERDTVRSTHRLVTTARAATGEVVGCRRVTGATPEPSGT